MSRAFAFPVKSNCKVCKLLPLDDTAAVRWRSGVASACRRL